MGNLVKSMWVGDCLSRMEYSCIMSWLRAGYEYELYVYDDVGNVPEGVKVCDGNKIIKSDKIFTYNQEASKGGGSVSGFSNFFRYKLLIEGGIWVDTDLFCVKRIPDSKYLLIKENSLVASCLLKMPSPMAEYCWKICNAKNPEELKWGETGPRLVKEAVTVFSVEDRVRDSRMYLPLMYSEVEAFFYNITIPQCYTMHFWNEVWRRKGLDKNATYGRDTLYEKLISSLNHPIHNP